MDIYTECLNYLKGILGDKSTYGSDLDIVCRRLFGSKFAGVFPVDRLQFGSGIYAIVNLDTSDKPGSHWCGCIKQSNSKLLVYDSFGRKSKKILPILSAKYKIQDTEDDVEQPIDFEDCGPRSIASIFVYDQYGKKKFLSL